MTFGALSVITASPPVMPLLYEAFITAVSVALLPENVMTALKTRVFRQPMENSGRGVRQLMLERLDDASQALREIAATTQAVSQKLDRARSGTDSVTTKQWTTSSLKCGLKTRCWQQEYGEYSRMYLTI